MTIDDALAAVLAHLSDAQVRTLAAACETARDADRAGALVPAGASPAAVSAVESLIGCWRSTPALTGAGIALALRAGWTARADSDARRARPVWTGPGATGAERLTAGVLHELLCDARESNCQELWI